MTRYRILPYRQGSKGAKALADALGGRVLKLEGSSFQKKMGDVVINWGNIDQFNKATFNAVDLRSATNKRSFFLKMRDSGNADIIPRFFTSRQDIPGDAYPIVCRTVLAGHSGEGIVIAQTPDDLVDAPLYVAYVKKQDEYRIHVGKSGDGVSIIAVQRKARRHDTPDSEVNWKVRNHQNGFVYVRQNVNPPACVLEVAKRALEVSGLDFGAGDVIYNAQQEKAYVLEINCAPGIEGTTVQDYVNFFTS